ncbi:MAG: beta-galactosidase [Candidatus Omnitrophota bacterium]
MRTEKKIRVDITPQTFGAYMGGGLGVYAPLELWKKEILYMKKAGLGIARFNCDAWDLIEPRKGEYNWEKIDMITALLRKNNIEILFTIPVSSSWNTTAEEKWIDTIKIPDSHFPAADLNDLEELCQELASRYKGVIKYWEAWNEPDLPVFWKGSPDPAEYMEVLRAVHKGIKKSDPGAQIVIGGIAEPLKKHFVGRLMRSGAAELFDIMNIHIYPGTDIDKVRRSVLAARDAIGKYDPGKPLWVTEISTTPAYYSPGETKNAEQEKAVFLVKSYMILLAEGVEKIFWHTLRNCGRDIGLSKDFDFGLLDSEYTALPAYLSARILLPKLDGCYRVEIKYPEKNSAVFKFDSEDSALIVAWGEAGEKSLEVPYSLKNPTVIDIFGNNVSFVAVDKKLIIPACDFPVIISGTERMENDHPYNVISKQNERRNQ